MGQLYTTRVSNTGPTNANILFVGESPGEEEERQKIPFVGPSGDLLTSCLGRAGVQREEVYLANLCQYRPYGNVFANTLGTKELESGKAEIADYIRSRRPTVVVALGSNPLQYLTGKSGISRYRGSVLPCSLAGCEDIKVIPTYHPSHVLRNRSDYPIFAADIERIVSDSRFREFRYPARNYYIDPTGLDLEEWVQRLSAADRIAVDIESVKRTKKQIVNNEPIKIICVGFAPSPDIGVCIPLDSPTKYHAVQRILSSQAKKVFHFGMFDVLMLALAGMQVENFWWDTLVGQHVLEPELPRSLEFLVSIYTREPYYKAEGRGEIPGDTKAWSEKSNKNDLYIYNCKDVCCTAEIQLEQEKEVNASGMRYIFDFEMEVGEAARLMSRTGLLVDLERRELMKKALLRKWAKLQFILDGLAGRNINVNSGPSVKKLLYTELGLPPRRKREGGLTADEDAIVACITHCKGYIANLKRKNAIQDWTVKLEICKLILEIRGIRKFLSSYVLARISEDNRIRSTYKTSNTETGRWAAQKYIDGTGVNAQTFPRDEVDVPDDLDALIDIDRMLKALEEEENAECQEEEEIFV